LFRTKTVPVLTSSNFFEIHNVKVAYCIRCQEPFEENNVIATSATNRRYYYKCALTINLVSVNMTKDLHLHTSSCKETDKYIKEISRKIHLGKSIEILTKEIIQRNFWTSRYFLINSKLLGGLDGNFM